MNTARNADPAPSASTPPQLRDTRDAFDSVAADYDGPRGNNDLIQDMRGEMWRWLDATFAPASRLIDLGCGTGLDAIRMAQLGHHITATDWSPQMVWRTSDRAEREHLTDRVRAVAVGAHELHRMDGDGVYDGAYSNLGPLNCVPDLADVSRECAPWEIAHYLRGGRSARAKIRFARNAVPVSMNNHTIWTRYYAPREFYRAFKSHFTLEHFRGLCVFAPPPYLTWVREKHPRWYDQLWRLDRRVCGFPVIRGLGDHFLIVMRRR